MTELDRPTRGRTAAGRLRALDAFLVHAETRLLSEEDGGWAGALFVDVGFGDFPDTTLEAATTFQTVNPRLRVVGVERDPSRVERAGAQSGGRADFRLGGFHLPLGAGERARLVRVMNVLRTYLEQDVGAAHALLGEAVLDGGLVVEGSAERDGSVLCAHLLRKEGAALRREALLFHTDFSRGFAPRLFRDWLPRDLRRRVRPGEPIHALLDAWTWSFEACRERERVADVFRSSLEHLAGRVRGVVLEPWLLAGGYFLWRPPGGVPA